MNKLVLLAVAGAAGTLARYGLSGVAQRALGAGFPWGTLSVNILGCFLAGLFWSLSEYRLNLSGETRIVVLMGFMGAFTTFSAFMLETSHLAREAEWFRVFANLALQNVAGAAAVFAGLFLGRLA